MDSRIPSPSMTLFSILKVKISHTKYWTRKGQKKIWNVIFSAHHVIYTLKHDRSYFTFDNVKWSDCFFSRYAHCRNDKDAEFQYKAGNNVFDWTFTYTSPICIQLIHLCSYVVCFCLSVFIFVTLCICVRLFFVRYTANFKEIKKKIEQFVFNNLHINQYLMSASYRRMTSCMSSAVRGAVLPLNFA